MDGQSQAKGGRDFSWVWAVSGPTGAPVSGRVCTAPGTAGVSITLICAQRGPQLSPAVLLAPGGNSDSPGRGLDGPRLYLGRRSPALIRLHRRGVGWQHEGMEALDTSSASPGGRHRTGAGRVILQFGKAGKEKVLGGQHGCHSLPPRPSKLCTLHWLPPPSFVGCKTITDDAPCANTRPTLPSSFSERLPRVWACVESSSVIDS